MGGLFVSRSDTGLRSVVGGGRGAIRVNIPTGGGLVDRP